MIEAHLATQLRIKMWQRSDSSFMFYVFAAQHRIIAHYTPRIYILTILGVFYGALSLLTFGQVQRGIWIGA
jgi:hypothetical protein